MIRTSSDDSTQGKPNYEHLNEDLHVILQCEDDETRALAKLKQAKEELNKLLTPPVGTHTHTLSLVSLNLIFSHLRVD